jgi:hypothetical protein
VAGDVSVAGTDDDSGDGTADDIPKFRLGDVGNTAGPPCLCAPVHTASFAMSPAYELQPIARTLRLFACSVPLIHGTPPGPHDCLLITYRLSSPGHQCQLTALTKAPGEHACEA